MPQIIAYPEWKKNISGHLNAYIRAKKKMLQDIGTFSQSEANTLEKSLNEILTNKDFKQNIAPKIGQIAQSMTKKDLSKVKIDGTLKASTPELSQAWSKYYTKKNEYDGIVNQLTNEQEAELKSLKNEALRLQGQVNKIQGDALEAFLQIFSAKAAEYAQSLGNGEVKKILKDLEKNFQLNNEKISFSTQGSTHREIKAELFDDKWTISSQGKVDVSVDSPLYNTLQISAKNYSHLRNIDLLGAGNVVGLVSQWPVSTSSKYYFYNALTVWNSPEEILNAGKMLFAIQSFSGASAQTELLANALIVNIRSSSHPIRVISIPAILNDTLSKDFINYRGQNPFQFKFNPSLQLFKQGEQREKSEFKTRVEQLTLDTTLNKAYLYLSYLKKLTK